MKRKGLFNDYLDACVVSRGACGILTMERVSEGFHDGGRFTLMKWNAGADATAMLNNGRITLTGHRASLIVSEHQIDVKIPSDRGFVITFR